MATTQNGIYYPTDGTQPADVLADMKKMAESMEEAIINNKFDPKEINDNITKIQEEQTTQNKAIEANTKSIKQNTTDITKLKEENAMLKAQIPTGQESREEISLSDSAEMELVEFGLQGNSKQETREGYNLANYNTKVDKNTPNFDIGDIKQQQVYTLYLYIPTGTISFNLKNKSNDSIILSDWNKTGKVLKTFTANQDDILHFNGFGSAGDYAGISEIMLLEGTYTTENLPAFEEYGVMPSLNYPSEVEAVGESENVEIVTSNKNLFNIPDFKGTQSGVTLNITNGNHIKITGTSTSGTTFYILNSNINKKKLENINKIAFGKTITIQKNSIPNNSIEFNVGVSGNGYFMQLFKSTLSKTALLSKEIIMFTIYIPANTEWDWETDLQFEISNQATDIVQPKGNTYTLPVQKPFYKLIGFGSQLNNEIKDTFIKQNNKWYEQHNNKKVLLKDLEWNYGATETGKDINTKRWNSTTKYPHYESGTDHYAKSNSFNNNSGNLYSQDKECFNIESNFICVRIPVEVAANPTQVKEYFTQRANEGKNDYVVYPLATPELIECTEEQVKVLEQIIADGTYKEVTHFYTTQDLKPTMEVKYYKDLETLLNKQEQLESTLNNVQAQILELGG